MLRSRNQNRKLVRADYMAKAKWYVYELVDPRYGEAFYVGKGCGDRIAAHEKEAKSKPMVCTEKLLKIRDIWDSGFEVERRHVAFFWDEQSAYDYEAERVAEYGLDALTNIIPGGGGVRGAYIAREAPVVEWTPEDYATAIVKNKVALSWFCFWLREKRIEVTGHKIYVAIVRTLMCTLFPKFWAKIKQSKDAIEILRPHLADNNIEMVYGGA